MKLVFIDNQRIVTDSLNVANTFGKEHRRVMQDIRELGCSEQFRLHHFVHTPYVHEQNGQTYEKCIMTEQGFTLLAFGYTGQKAMEFKEEYINQFESMRQALTQRSLPQNYKEALLALVGEVDRREKAEELNSINAPKVALYEVAISAKNNLTMNAVAKSLGYGRNKLFDFLREQKVLMRNNLPYETYVQRGYFDVRQYTITHFTQDLENKSQTLVTPKGVAWIHDLLVKNGRLSA